MTKYEYRIRYRREDWVCAQQRIFQYRGHVDRFVEKLTSWSPRWDGLAPLAHITIQRREVGEWRNTNDDD